MARIDTYTSQVGLAAPGPVQVGLADPIGPAISRLGGALADIAEHRQARQQQKEDFQADNDYRAMNLKLGQELDLRADDSADGSGLHDDFISNVFRPARDAFLQNLPPRLRQKYGSEMSDDPNQPGAAFEGWSVKAATRERDLTYKWADQSVQETEAQLENAIADNPDQYDELLKEGRDKINSSPSTVAYKRAELLKWENRAQQAKLTQMLDSRPEDVIRELGGDPRNLSRGTMLGMLVDAMIGQESHGDPSAVSGRGALGILQVMPGTARDIAKEIKDPDFPFHGDPTDVARYLFNASVNKRYGTYYLSKLLKDFSVKGKPDVEAALIGYNGGPEVAKKWLESGRDDSVLPNETRKYYKQVLARMRPPRNAGTAANVEFVWARPARAGGLQAGASDLEHTVNPDLRARVGAAFGAIGEQKVRVTSGFRDEAHNRAVGGAEKSQHLSGNALDIDLTNMPLARRIELIRSLSANGVTGIGVYSNRIHADLGGRRAWGPDNSANSVPKWAQAAIKDHLNNTATPPTNTTARFASLPFASRQEFLAKADAIVSRRQNESTTADLQARNELRQNMNDELARIGATGQQSPTFDETQIATMFGEDKYAEWADKREAAQKTFVATQGIETMTPEAAQDRLSQYAVDPNSDNFATDQKVYAAVLKKITETETMRARHPDQAALKYPEVKQQFDAIQQQMAKGETPDPKVVQAFVRDMLAKQADFGVRPEARAPVPEDWALRVGQALSRVPEISGHNAGDVRLAIATQYKALQQVFGEYADDVIVYALAQYKGLSKTNAELIGNYMKAIAGGGDPFRLNPNQQQDMDQMEQASDPGFFGRIGRWLLGEGDATQSASEAERALRARQDAEQ